MAGPQLFVNADGLYWHSEANRGRTYHRDLRLAFEAEGLRILQFYEDEILHRPEIVKSVVAAVGGKIGKRVAARRCELSAVEPPTASAFLDANHLMGHVAATCIGLSYQGQLIQVLSFKRYSDYIEIVRSAGLLNTVVVGGFQKLLAALRRRHPGLPIQTLVDLRYADGHSLELAGFAPVREYLQYQYINNRCQRRDKRHFRVGAGVDERQAAADQGWYRIYDAGRRVYRLTSMDGTRS